MITKDISCTVHSFYGKTKRVTNKADKYEPRCRSLCFCCRNTQNFAVRFRSSTTLSMTKDIPEIL